MIRESTAPAHPSGARTLVADTSLPAAYPRNGETATEGYLLAPAKQPGDRRASRSRPRQGRALLWPSKGFNVKVSGAGDYVVEANVYMPRLPAEEFMDLM